MAKRTSIRLTLDNLDDALAQITLDLRQACCQDVAEETGLSLTTIQRWQRGGPHRAPRLKSFIRFCDYFGYNVEMHVLYELSLVG